MSWTTITKYGGFIKYYKDDIGDEESIVLTLAGSGALIQAENEIDINTAGKDGVYSKLLTTIANQEVAIPAGAHLLKCEDVDDGGGVIVYVTDSGIEQDTLTIGGIGQDPS